MQLPHSERSPFFALPPPPFIENEATSIFLNVFVTVSALELQRPGDTHTRTHTLTLTFQTPLFISISLRLCMIIGCGVNIYIYKRSERQVCFSLATDCGPLACAFMSTGMQSMKNNHLIVLFFSLFFREKN